MTKNYFFILLFLITCCGIESDGLASREKVGLFTRDDFSTVKKPVAEIIPFDKSLNPRSYRIVRDSILLVELMNNSSLEYWVEMYKFPGMKFMGKILPKGKGPGEFLTVDIKYQSCKDEFIIYDMIQNKMAVYNIDSVLLGLDSYIPEQINIEYDIKNIEKFNDSLFLGYNAFFFHDSEYSNGVEELILFKGDGIPVSELKNIMDFEFFTHNVTGGGLLINPSKNKIFVPNHYVDRINIYDQELNPQGQLYGPDQIAPEYKMVQNKMVVWKVKPLRAFSFSWYTPKYMYLLYNSSNNEENRDKPYDRSNPFGHLLGPMELFQLNWEGELLTRYEFDIFLFEISIDCNEEYLYGTHWKKYGEEYPKLIRYEL